MSDITELKHEQLDALLNDANTPGPVKDFLTGLSATTGYLNTVSVEGDDESGYKVVAKEPEPEAEDEATEETAEAKEPAQTPMGGVAQAQAPAQTPAGGVEAPTTPAA